MFQFPEETVYSFVLRCLGVRQEMLLLSGKPENLCYIQYSL